MPQPIRSSLAIKSFHPPGDPDGKSGRAVIARGKEVLKTVPTGPNIPHNYVLWIEMDGDDAWVGTSKGLGWAVGDGYYAGQKAGSPEGGE